jgi:hypothetical protein
MNATEADRYLPGYPSNALIRRVRRQLASYGIRPHRESLWRTCWSWADAVARSYVWRKSWPLPREIAAQYVLLLLNDMNADHALKLPYRAQAHAPGHIARVIHGPAQRAIPFLPEEHNP